MCKILAKIIKLYGSWSSSKFSIFQTNLTWFLGNNRALSKRADVVYVSTRLRVSVVYVPTCLRANVPKACQLLIFTCQRANKRAIRHANVSVWRVNVPKDVTIFQIFLLRNATGNFYTLLL